MVTTTQLQNYKNSCNTIKQGDVWRIFLKGIIPQLTRSCHSMPKIIKMTANHFFLSHTRLATVKSTESMPKARNKALLDPTLLNNNGIQIHERLVSQFCTTFTNGVQGIPMMATHPTRYMPITLARYPISVKNDGIPIVLFENSSFYNKIHTKLVEALKKKSL